jgi:hypothetical protein
MSKGGIVDKIPVEMFIDCYCIRILNILKLEYIRKIKTSDLHCLFNNKRIMYI